MSTILEKMTFLSGTENRETFFKRVGELFPTLDPRYQAIEKAYNASKDAFRDEKREGGDRYFEHLRAVALILIVHLRIKDHQIIIAALLHDIVEDIPSWDIIRVKAEFGHEIALLVEWLTKPPISKFNESKEDRDGFYHKRFESAPREFFLIKLADRLHNLITLHSCPPEKIIRKIEETKRYYLPYAEKHCILIHELEHAIKRANTLIKKPRKQGGK